MSIVVASISPADVAGRAAEIVAIYGAVFAGPPYYESADDITYFRQRALRHAQRPGFSGYFALDRNKLVGFAYGFTCRGGWVWEQLIAGLSLDEALRWTTDTFELVELALLPHAQGQGIGGQLHDCLLASVPHPRAVLATAQVDSSAMSLYRKRGWRNLVSDLGYGSHGLVYTIMGRELVGPQGQ